MGLVLADVFLSSCFAFSTLHYFSPLLSHLYFLSFSFSRCACLVALAGGEAYRLRVSRGFITFKELLRLRGGLSLSVGLMVHSERCRIMACPIQIQIISGGGESGGEGSGGEGEVGLPGELDDVADAAVVVGAAGGEEAGGLLVGGRVGVGIVEEGADGGEEGGDIDHGTPLVLEHCVGRRVLSRQILPSL
jgi:hypothetical protein